MLASATAAVSLFPNALHVEEIIMATQAPIVDGIGIANLPNQVRILRVRPVDGNVDAFFLA